MRARAPVSCVCRCGLVEDGILTVSPSCRKREYFDFFFDLKNTAIDFIFGHTNDSVYEDHFCV